MMSPRGVCGRAFLLPTRRLSADSRGINAAREVPIEYLRTTTFRRGRLARCLRSYGQAPHAPALAVIVVDRVVLGAAVVPNGERPRGPAHTAGKLGPRLVRLQPVNEREALLLAHVLEADRVAAAHVQGLAPGFGMGASHRMLGFVLAGGVSVLQLHAGALLVDFAAPAPAREGC